MKQTLIQAYGSDKAGLLACGIVVASRAPRSGATNAIAAAKSAETRKVNGTGKKSPVPKAQVLDENGQVIGQPASSPAPMVAAAPATPAAGNAEPAPTVGAAQGT